MKAKLNTDGGARGNPGPAGIGIFLQDLDGELVLEHAESIGETTNNVAEYKALIKGLELALESGVTEIDAYVDSELVASQVRGEWKIKNEALRPLAIKAEVLLRKFDKATLHHVRREKNAEADRLANRAMDEAAAGRAYLESEREMQLGFDSDE